MFNPRPQVQVVPLFDGHHALVVDNVLQDPQRWVDWADAQREHFSPSGQAFPGLELWLAEGAEAQLADFFAQHVRSLLGARRTLQLSLRLSLVTLTPEALLPRQRLCHRDNPGVPQGQCMVASVLYLFHAPVLGGTSFFKPRRGPEQMQQLTQDARELSAHNFQQRYPELGSGFMVDSNPWFERMATLPAAWNRAIFYEGGLYHSGDIRPPQLMVASAHEGRLTMNGFMRCSRILTPEAPA